MQIACTNKRKTENILNPHGNKNLARLVFILLTLLVCLSACAPNSGIFAGGTWQSGGLQHLHIRALAVDPNNTQNIYAGDAQNGVLVSTDAGAHWSQRNAGLPSPTAIHNLAFDNAGKKLYAATDAGVFVSTDAVQHWTAIGGLPAGSYTALAFDLNKPQTIFVGTAHHGVFTSTNDGSTWSAADGGLPAGIEINGLTFDSAQPQLWAATNMGVYRFNDAGSTWQALNNGLPAAIVVNTVLPASISGGDQGLLFAGTNHGFFRSQDAGVHWSMSQESLAGITVYAIMIDFNKVTTVYIGSSVGVLRSDDNGQNWGGVASGLPRGQSVFALAFGASGYSQIYAAANDVYLYPGSSGGFDASRLVPLLLIAVFFYLLYRLAFRGRRQRREILKPERSIESLAPSNTSESPLKANAQGNIQNNDVRPVAPKSEVINEAESGMDGREEDA